jgi:hypothetical protein
MLSKVAGGYESTTTHTKREAKWYDKAGAFVHTGLEGVATAMDAMSKNGPSPDFDPKETYHSIIDEWTTESDTVSTFKRNEDLYKKQIAFL